MEFFLPFIVVPAFGLLFFAIYQLVWLFSSWRELSKKYSVSAATWQGHRKWKAYTFDTRGRAPEPLKVSILEGGLYLDPPSFRFGWPALFVPWDAIKYESPEKWHWTKTTYVFKLAERLVISVEADGYNQICRQVANLMSDREGRVSGLFLGTEKGEPKTSQTSLNLVTGSGVQGDAHAGKREDRQISLFSQDVFDALQQEGFEVEPGQLSANLFVADFLLDGLPQGTVIGIGAVRLTIVEPRNPCSSTTKIDIRLPKRLYGRCGQFARVTVGGTIHLNDKVTILPAR